MTVRESRRSAVARPDDESGRAADPAGPADGSWVRLRSLWRFVVVAYQFAPLVFAYVRDRRRYVILGGRRSVSADTRTRRAEYLLATLFDLGPTFIKLGQILSTRPDALPAEYIEVLSRLQDAVPPVAWERVRPVVESELGPIEERFDDFDTEAISGASLGQVYTAHVDGDRVAVKVLRPDIRARVEADLRVVNTLLPVVVFFTPRGQSFTFENLAEEFASTIREEMDYRHEATMLRTIGANFADDPDVVVPDVRETHSTGRVLTMEYVDGTKIDDVDALEAKGIDREALVRRLEEAYIQMIIEDGLFHADPHPGNLAVTDDGSLVFYDFGMTGRLDEYVQDQLLEFYIAVAEDDIDAIIDAFEAMGALDPDADRALMREVFELAIENFRGGDLDEYRIQRIVSEFQATMYQFPLRLPQNLALIVRVTTVLEGVCLTLDPEFDFIEVVTEYVKREGYGGESAEQLLARVGARYGQDLQRSVRRLATVPPKADRVLDKIQRDELSTRIVLDDERDAFGRFAVRVVLGLLVGALALSTSLLFAFSDLRAAQVAAGATCLVGVAFLRAMRKQSGIRARPQFTRQAMRERQNR